MNIAQLEARFAKRVHCLDICLRAYVTLAFFICQKSNVVHYWIRSDEALKRLQLQLSCAPPSPARRNHAAIDLQPFVEVVVRTCRLNLLSEIGFEPSEVLVSLRQFVARVMKYVFHVG